jgi:hypothetical protein
MEIMMKGILRFLLRNINFTLYIGMKQQTHGKPNFRVFPDEEEAKRWAESGKPAFAATSDVTVNGRDLASLI